MPEKVGMTMTQDVEVALKEGQELHPQWASHAFLGAPAAQQGFGNKESCLFKIIFFCLSRSSQGENIELGIPRLKLESWPNL